MATKKVKSYLYTRISSLQQQSGFGIQRQINNVMDFLSEAQLPLALGYQLDPENYELLESDLGKSAYKGHNFTKGALGRFKELVTSGQITEGVLVIENVDRFSRLPDYEAIEHFNALIKRGIDVIEVEGGQVFSTKIDGTLSKLAVSIERSHQESKRKARLSTKNWEKMKKEALEGSKALKNNCPAWLSIVNEQYEINNDITETINYLFEKFVEGYGGATLVRHLNDTGRLFNGKRWSTVSLYNTLRNRRLIGFINDTKYYPVVVPIELFYRAQSKIDSTLLSKKRGTTKYQRSLFNGMAKCGVCGSAMIVHSTTKGILYFRCHDRRSQKTNCGNGLIRYKETERCLLSYISNIDFSYVYSEKENNSKLTILREKLRVLNESIDEFNAEIKDSDSDVILSLVRHLKKKLKEKTEIESELEGVDISYEPKEYNYNIDEVINQENIELRQKTNVVLRKVIRDIKISRVSHNGEDYYLIVMNYHSDIVQHLLVINKFGVVQAECSVSNDLHYKSTCMDIELLTGKITHYREPTEIDELMVSYWLRVFESAKEIIAANNAQGM